MTCPTLSHGEASASPNIENQAQGMVKFSFLTPQKRRRLRPSNITKDETRRHCVQYMKPRIMRKRVEEHGLTEDSSNRCCHPGRDGPRHIAIFFLKTKRSESCFIQWNNA
jgi:IS5 family transposase